MIARLRGILVERKAGAVVVECGGVGYEAVASLATLSALPEVGTEVILRIYTHAQENRVALYGFFDAEERELFDRLITVKNVGPQTAVAILSGARSARELADTIAAGDVGALTRIRGIGKKTAELLVVELRERCAELLGSWGAAQNLPGAGEAVVSRRRGRPQVLDDVALALVGLGWRAAEVDKVVSRLEVPMGSSVESLLKDALRAMPRS